jgi:hypothetical protein
MGRFVGFLRFKTMNIYIVQVKVKSGSGFLKPMNLNYIHRFRTLTNIFESTNEPIFRVVAHKKLNLASC